MLWNCSSCSTIPWDSILILSSVNSCELLFWFFQNRKVIHLSLHLGLYFPLSKNSSSHCPRLIHFWQFLVFSQRELLFILQWRKFSLKILYHLWIIHISKLAPVTLWLNSLNAFMLMNSHKQTLPKCLHKRCLGFGECRIAVRSSGNTK